MHMHPGNFFQCLFLFLYLSAVSVAVPDLAFQVSSGGNDNYFLRDNVTSAQLVLTSPDNTLSSVRRIVFALPGGNTGALATTDDFQNVGAQADFTFSGNATLGVIIIGAVRAMRDYVEGSGTMHEIFNYTLESYSSTFVHLHRQYINTTFQNSGVFKGSDAHFLVTPRAIPEETEGNSWHRTALKGLADGTNSAAQQVSFLTYADKFTAGGWRFLTYFGRDSLIALRLLMPTLTPEAIETALGDYASFININNNRSDLGNTPFYDYKVSYNRLLRNLLLLPSVSHYFLELPKGGRQASLQNGTYADILNRIANYNLQRAIPFSQKQTFSNLLAFRPGEPVGNWRDSNEGTGYGPIPFDVNAALVPASLRATQSLIGAGILMASNSSADAGKVADVWEAKAIGLFEVRVQRKVAEERLVDFVSQVGLDKSLLEDVSFYALSLRSDGSPVEVMNSDLGFNLMYGINVSKTFLQYTIDALTPYPQGLLTNIGMVVANPAYDANRTNVHLLDRTAYHGTVVWSFQQGLMAGGIARQLGFCSPNNKVFVQNLRDAQGKLWASINGAKDHIFSEVWSYSFNRTTNQFDIADLAGLSPTGTESDAIQLWSYGFLGLLDPSGVATSS
ncbi:hypothetical protein BD779DRAFT_1578468 [Infundibulicybe gibba]|nr:hypothetical protein BD779DRAFT_1578468 [Infundibulicybe gibba]